VIGVKLNTRIQKRKDADVKRMMRRGVNRLKPNTMTNAVQLYGEMGLRGDGWVIWTFATTRAGRGSCFAQGRITDVAGLAPRRGDMMRVGRRRAMT
jgi:hypothetical protein